MAAAKPQSEEYEFCARCAGGFEGLLAAELKEMGIRRIRPLSGGVVFYGGKEAMYRACLWSRIASRVLLVLSRFNASDADALYSGAYSLDWSRHIPPGASISVHAHGSNENLRNTNYTALRVKDAICDKLRWLRGERPDVDPEDPDIEIDVSINRKRATLSLNASGKPLHMRGYRLAGVQVDAPLKETLAAAVVLYAGWKEAAGRGAMFFDPMCGSGTLALEAAMVAGDVAPGALRSKWGFGAWCQHDDRLWDRVRSEAAERMEAGLAHMPRIVAGDLDAEAVAIARSNADRAGLGEFIEFHNADACEAEDYLHRSGAPDPGEVVMCVNPPYGRRLCVDGGLQRAYDAIASAVGALPSGCRLAVISPDESIDSALGFVPESIVSLYNGAIETKLRCYSAAQEDRMSLPLVSVSGVESTVAVAEQNSAQFAARLRKVAKERMKWARRDGVGCYRIYDADLPDYSFSVDVYEGAGKDAGKRCLVVCEYAPPRTVDPERAKRRFNDALRICPAILDADANRIESKTRRREAGGGQYRDAAAASRTLITSEGGYEFEVDLAGHIDTGIFLDHRITRLMLGRMAAGKRFLNLFAYTGTATVHAAGGGAATTTTVDMSKTYLDWARRNMRRNGFGGPEHRFVWADVSAWLRGEAKSSRRYDLIFCDPPTFSNSKTMGTRTWAVQRDYMKMLVAVKRLLAPGGTIVFSCNLRNFKMDDEALAGEGLYAQDITRATIPHDFERNPRIHRCFFIVEASRRAAASAADAAGIAARGFAGKGEYADGR